MTTITSIFVWQGFFKSAFTSSESDYWEGHIGMAQACCDLADKIDGLYTYLWDKYELQGYGVFDYEVPETLGAILRRDHKVTNEEIANEFIRFFLHGNDVVGTPAFNADILEFLKDKYGK